MLTNKEKQESYTYLKERLKRALASGFWFEACMIEYAIMEDRTSSILFHAGVFPAEVAFSEKKMMRNKLNSIDHQIGKGHPILSKKVSQENIHQILLWIDRRNETVHRACTHVLNDEILEQIATEGKQLVDRLSNDSQKVSRLAQKLAQNK